MFALSSRPDAGEATPYFFNYINQVPDGDILQTLQTQRPIIHSLLAHISDEAATVSPAPGEWSIKQVVAHVSDTERLFSFRALWFARGERAELPGMEPDPWIENSNSNDRDLADLLKEFDYIRSATLALLTNLDTTAWQRRGVASGGVFSVRALAWTIAGHELHHIRSLREVYL